jgi:hypothetical protein
MSDHLSLAVRVLALTEAGACVMKVTASSTATDSLWLGRHRGATYVDPPVEGQTCTVLLPLWAAKFHPRQLAADIEEHQRQSHQLRQARLDYAKPIATPATQKASNMATTKDNSGALFKNPRKAENPNAPDYTGDLLYNGVRLRLAGWVKESARGKFLSLSVKPDEQQPDGKPAAKKPAMADDLTF